MRKTRFAFFQPDNPSGATNRAKEARRSAFAPFEFSSSSIRDGSSLEGRTILLHAEQGLGDVIQFIRYADLVKERGSRVIALCPPPLIGLLRSGPGIDLLLPEGSEVPPFQVHAPLLSLPRILGTTLDTVPASVPYLFPEADRVFDWRRKLDRFEGLKVGIVWQGNPRHKRDRHRSFPLKVLLPLSLVPGVRLVSLQKGSGTDQIPPLADKMRLICANERAADAAGEFEDLAALMAALDLVISADTVVAHLAGALGVPVWVALPFLPDWRWLLQREDSPWYPTMRLYRQSAPEEWPEVFERMANDLKLFMAKARSTPGSSPKRRSLASRS